MKEKDINKARAVYYKIFSNFFVYTQEINKYFELLGLIDIVKENSLDDNSKEAFKNISNKLQKDTNIKLLQEFDNIFHNPQTPVVRTTASFYDEGVESGKKRVQMLDFLAKTKIRRDEKKFFEHEDSIGFIFTVLSELGFLVSNEEENYKNLQHCIFAQILNDFVDDFSKSVYEHENADIYKDIIVALLSFMEFERMYFDVPRTKVKEAQKIGIKKEISQKEKERRAKNKALRESGPKE